MVRRKVRLLNYALSAIKPDIWQKSAQIEVVDNRMLVRDREGKEIEAAEVVR